LAWRTSIRRPLHGLDELPAGPQIGLDVGQHWSRNPGDGCAASLETSAAHGQRWRPPRVTRQIAARRFGQLCRQEAPPDLVIVAGVDGEVAKVAAVEELVEDVRAEHD
jgi:hypothetical protein